MKTYRKLLRARNTRKEQLAYAYYLGELLEQYPEEHLSTLDYQALI